MPSQADKRAAWVAQCVANANPHSDEEPEDFIRQCAHEGEQLFCERELSVRVGYRRWVTCAEAVGEFAEACEEVLGHE